MDEICVLLFFSFWCLCSSPVYTCLSRTNKGVDPNLFVMSETRLGFWFAYYQEVLFTPWVHRTQQRDASCIQGGTKARVQVISLAALSCEWFNVEVVVTIPFGIAKKIQFSQAVLFSLQNCATNRKLRGWKKKTHFHATSGIRATRCFPP